MSKTRRKISKSRQKPSQFTRLQKRPVPTMSTAPIAPTASTAPSAPAQQQPFQQHTKLFFSINSVLRHRKTSKSRQKPSQYTRILKRVRIQSAAKISSTSATAFTTAATTPTTPATSTAPVAPGSSVSPCQRFFFYLTMSKTRRKTSQSRQKPSHLTRLQKSHRLPVPNMFTAPTAPTAPAAPAQQHLFQQQPAQHQHVGPAAAQGDTVFPRWSCSSKWTSFTRGNGTSTPPLSDNCTYDTIKSNNIHLSTISSYPSPRGPACPIRVRQRRKMESLRREWER
jgi:hypothetical protein